MLKGNVLIQFRFKDWTLLMGKLSLILLKDPSAFITPG